MIKEIHHEKIKKLVLHKNRAFNAYSRDKNNTDLFNKFQSLQAHLKTSIEGSKQNYYSRLSNKLLDSKTSPKSYWSILKTFLNNKKIPYIPPLLHNGKFIMDFKEMTVTSLRGSVLLLTIRTGKTVLFNSVQEWLVGCF